MEDNYLRYSMSVIVARALPDVRDGLKPVHSRILYTMNRDGLRVSAQNIVKVLMLLELSWVTSTHTVMPLYMMPWFVWLKIGVCDIR